MLRKRWSREGFSGGGIKPSNSYGCAVYYYISPFICGLSTGSCYILLYTLKATIVLVRLTKRETNGHYETWGHLINRPDEESIPLVLGHSFAFGILTALGRTGGLGR